MFVIFFSFLCLQQGDALSPENLAAYKRACKNGIAIIKRGRLMTVGAAGQTIRNCLSLKLVYPKSHIQNKCALFGSRSSYWELSIVLQKVGHQSIKNCQYANNTLGSGWVIRIVHVGSYHMMTRKYIIHMEKSLSISKRGFASVAGNFL